MLLHDRLLLIQIVALRELKSALAVFMLEFATLTFDYLVFVELCLVEPEMFLKRSLFVFKSISY